MYRSNETQPQEADSERSTTTTNTSNTSTAPNEQKAQPLTIRQYVTQNISKLSPKPEVLGGKFYIIRLDAANGKGFVIYEDGHNAYQADFTYTFDEDGNPEVTSFKIRE